MIYFLDHVFLFLSHKDCASLENLSLLRFNSEGNFSLLKPSKQIYKKLIKKGSIMLIRGLIALAFGTLSLGITEFVAMGLLPYVAKDFNVSLDTAGHIISFYATGVATGAFTLLFVRQFKLKHILLCLIVVHILGNAITVFANDFSTLLIARFISGLPHGCYFGVASIIASRLATQGKGTSAIAIMAAGMTVANVFGAPLGTAMAQSLSWRSIFILVTLWGLIVLTSVAFWVKDTGRCADTGFKGQFVFLKDKAAWLVLGATLFSNGGIFCMLSYLSPLLTKVSGLPIEMVSIVMVAMGICMVLFNLVSGRLCDKFTPGKVSTVWISISSIILIAIAFTADIKIVAIPLICIAGGILFATASPFQMLILRVAKGGQLLGGASIQAAFNLGNALGAFAGGLVFTFSLDLHLIPVFGFIINVMGLICVFFFAKNHERRFSVEKIKTLPGNEDIA